MKTQVIVAAQQSVHVTLGILREPQAVFKSQPFSHRAAFRCPPQRR